MKRMTNLRDCVLLFAAVVAACGVVRLVTGTRTAHAANNHAQVGAQIVAHGTPSGAIACVRCHGYDGASDGSGAFSILAGQTTYYLTEQLRNFASGKRQNALMSSVAKGLTDNQIQDAAAYYAAGRPTLAVTRQEPADLVSRGQYIGTEGNLQNRVQGCISCHGPNGSGESPAIPYIGGQYKHYIEVQLKMFRRGYRKSPQMGTVGHRLSDDEAAAVAAYFDQLPLPTAK
jgi:cytochrome c553